jgi:hypothetical protein
LAILPSLQRPNNTSRKLKQLLAFLAQVLVLVLTAMQPLMLFDLSRFKVKTQKGLTRRREYRGV